MLISDAAIVYPKDFVIEALSDGVVMRKNNWKSNKKEFLLFAFNICEV